jgi:hypothetical protein
MKPIRFLALAAGLALLAPAAARAQATYKIQPIVKLGDMAGDVLIATNRLLGVEGLNDNGQILLLVPTRSWQPRLLFQYIDGKFTPIVVPGRDAPGGKWPSGVIVRRPLYMNQRGNVAFTANINIGGKLSWGTFRWDATAQQVTAVALKGMPAVNNLMFEQGGASFATGAAINNHDEIAFAAEVKSSHGQDAGLFFLGRDAKLLPVALPDQELPGGGKLQSAVFPSLNDAGMVAFPGWRFGSNGASGYVWEQGTITPVALVGQDAPGGGKVAEVTYIWLNNTNRTMLVSALLQGGSQQLLYRFAEGQLTPVLVPGQEMPGGGKVRGDNGISGISWANDAGQHAFTAVLEDGSTGLYRLDPDGKLSLLLKSGATSELGTITRIGARYATGLINSSYGVGFNNKGQIAVPVTIDNGVETVVLLTPAAP